MILVQTKKPPGGQARTLGHPERRGSGDDQELGRRRAADTMNRAEGQLHTGFEIWDRTTHNVLQFDRLDEAIVALRGLVRRGGDAAVDGLSLDAVSADGVQRMTLAEDAALLELIMASATSAR